MTTAFAILFAASFVILLFVAVKLMLQRDAARTDATAVNYQLGVKETVIADQDDKLCTMARRMNAAEADADRLAKIVDEYITLTSAVCETMKDDHPPSMQHEHDALRFHAEQLKLRPSPTYGTTTEPGKDHPTAAEETQRPNPRTNELG